MTDDTHAREKEDRLLRRHRTYSSTLIGSIIVFVMFAIVWCVVLVIDTNHNEPTMRYFLLALFWAVVSCYAKARLDHIATIRRYREHAET